MLMNRLDKGGDVAMMNGVSQKPSYVRNIDFFDYSHEM
jgi:hypothetical protein